MNPLKILGGFFSKRKKSFEFPPEFVLVTYTDEGRKYGTFDDFTKEIRLYKGNEFESYPYSSSLLMAMEELGFPIHDITREQIEIPIIKKIDPSEVRYSV